MTSRFTRFQNNYYSNDEYENYGTDLIARDIRPQEENAMVLQGSGEMQEWQTREKNAMQGVRMSHRRGVLNMGPSTSSYLQEGKKHLAQSSYSLDNSLEKSYQKDRFDDVGYLVDDPAELLRKLDELRDKIRQTCDFDNKSKDKVLPYRRMDSRDSYYRRDKGIPQGVSVASGSSMAFHEKYTARMPYIDHYANQSPYGEEDELFPSTYGCGHGSDCEHCFMSQQLQRGMHEPYAPFEHKLYDAHFSGSYTDRNLMHMDSFESYPPNMKHHDPLCSCLHCNGKNKVPMIAYGNRLFPHHDREDQAPYHYGSVNGLQRQGTVSKASGLSSVESYHSESHSGQMDGVVSSHPPRFVIENSAHLCQPIAGGAPFLTCLKCFLILQLPKKLLSGSKNEKKLQCGACSAILLLVLDANKIVLSVCSEDHQTYQEPDISINQSSTALGHSARKEMSFSSEECHPCDSVFQPGEELDSRPTGDVSLSKSGEVRSVRSVYSSSSNKAEKLAREKDSNSTEMLVKARISPPPAGSPLQVYFDYSDKFRVMQRLGGRHGKISRLYDPNESPKQSGISRQDTAKAGSEIEIDIPSNELINTASTLDSCGAIKEAVIKGPESLLAEMKTSSGNFNESKAQEMVAVTINGNLIPDRLIKKAEEQAGPIHSGHYWYDFRAGFWGVMGGPCSGIIPPFIEEFNYPMPKTCTGGKTGVLVNGRELHPKDLKLLARRGLPDERDRSYIIEISGRVIDEDTGEELKNLGKLAPSVEKLKRGFGMKDKQHLSS